MSKKWLIVAGICGLLALWVAAPFVSEFVSVDGCLDSGGSYDYARGVCHHQANHPYVPYTQRHPHTLGTFSAAAGMFVIAVVASRVASRRR